MDSTAGRSSNPAAALLPRALQEGGSLSKESKVAGAIWLGGGVQEAGRLA